MENFKIEFDTPSAVYSPGQPVTGKVILTNQSSLNALHLKVFIFGEAKTSWKKYEKKSGFDRTGKYYQYCEDIKYTSKQPYLKGVCQPWTSLDGNTKIPAGLNIFPFAFQLPSNCPPSFDGTHGHVRYTVHVELHRPWRFDIKSERIFSVIPHVDLNRIPIAINPMVAHSCKHFGFLSSKEVKMQVNVPKRGYTPGEVIPIKVHLDNHSKKPIFQLEAKLVQHVHYTAQQENSHMFPDEHKKHCEHKTAKTTMAEVQKSVRVECCSQMDVEIPLVLPNPCVVSFLTPIIEVDYCLIVACEGSMRKSMLVEMPVIVGTVPIGTPLTMNPQRLSEMAPLPPPPEYQELTPPPYSATPSAPVDSEIINEDLHL